MIVKYVKDRMNNSVFDKPFNKSKPDPFYTIGKNYIVLGLHFSKDSVLYRITVQGDEDGSAISPLIENFEIIDHRIPPNWIINQGIDTTIEPCEFDTDDFWELYHNKNSEAEALYEKVVLKLYHFHGWPADKIVW